MQRREHADPECDSHDVDRHQNREREPRVVQGMAAQGEGRAHQHRSDARGRTDRAVVRDEEADKHEPGQAHPEAFSERTAGDHAEDQRIECARRRAAGEEGGAHRNAKRGEKRGNDGDRHREPANRKRRRTVEPGKAEQDEHAARSDERGEDGAGLDQNGDCGNAVQVGQRRPPRDRYGRTSNVNPPLIGCPSSARPRHRTE